MKTYNTIIIGAGAAGLMCAWQASENGKSVAILEHTKKIGEKIRISGGGRCNFTNLYSTPNNFISQNPHFCKSALARFTPHDFIALLDEKKIAWHEKPYEEKSGNENARGQLFCDNSALDIINMLRDKCEKNKVNIFTETRIKVVTGAEHDFQIETEKGTFSCKNLVIATGGLSIPKIGATDFGYRIAKQYKINIIKPVAALVPFTFDQNTLQTTKPLSGVSCDVIASCNDTSFRENLLFTHRGLSGPAILQLSSYWKEKTPISINFTPDINALEHLKNMREKHPKQQLGTILSNLIPQRISTLIADSKTLETKITDLSNNKLQSVSYNLKSWQITPIGTEGYRTAEVTLGGVDTNEVSSKTFESNKVKGLYFIGEVLDVTGHLGGHNFQWAWASGWCAGQSIS